MNFSGSQTLQTLKQELFTVFSLNETPYAYVFAKPTGKDAGWSFGVPQYDMGQGGSEPFKDVTDFNDVFINILLSAQVNGKYVFDADVTKNRTLATCTQANAAFLMAKGKNPTIDAAKLANINAALSSAAGQSIIDPYTDQYLGGMIAKIQKIINGASGFAQTNLFFVLSGDELNWIGPGTSAISEAVTGAAFKGYQRTDPLNLGNEIDYYFHHRASTILQAQQAFIRTANAVKSVGGYTFTDLDSAKDAIRAYTYLYLKFESLLLEDPSYVANVNSFLSQVVLPAAALVAPWLESTYSISFNNYSSQDIFIGENAAPSLMGQSLGTLSAINDTANEILIAGDGNFEVSAGTGADILIAGVGNDLLTGGSSANDTLFGGQGIDTLVGGSGTNVFEFVGSGSNSNKEIIKSRSGKGSILINGTSTPIGTNLTAIAGSKPTWSGASANGVLSYVFDAPAGESVGTLTISGAGLGGGTIEIDGFDLTMAQTASGYLGIHLPNSAKAAMGTPTAEQVFAGNSSTQGTLSKDGSQTFSVLLAEAAPTDSTLVVKISGAGAGDFALSTGSELINFTNGQAIVSLDAGADERSFSLINTTDPGQSTSAQLDFSVLNADGSDSGIAVNSLEFNLVEDPDEDRQFTSLVGAPSGTNQMSYISPGNSINDIVDAGDTNNIITTYGGDDSITSGTGADTITTLSGDDTISGGGGADVIVAGDGDNEIYANKKTDLDAAIEDAEDGIASGLKGSAIGAGDGNNTIFGDDDNDLIAVGQGDNIIVAGPGSDLVVTGGAVQSMQSNWGWEPIADWHVEYTGVLLKNPNYGNGTTPYEGGKMYDSVSQEYVPLGMGNDTIYGGKGDSIFFLSNGDNYIDAGGGNDQIAGGMGRDTIFASSGDSTIFGGGGDTYIDGETGNSILLGEGGNNTIMGGSGDDTIFAGDDAEMASEFFDSTWDKAETGKNFVDGGSGDDLIYGSGGNDTLIAGSGDTTIYGGYGNEYIEGGSGTDVLISDSGASGSEGAGTTTIVAGEGATTIVGGAGDDSLYGGDGTDFIQAGTGNQLIETGDGGTINAPTQVLLGAGNSTVYGGAGIDQVWGGNGADTMIAGSGDTTLSGGSSTDVMYAGDGNDVLIATTGSDTMYGGEGNATMQGGSGLVEMYAGDGEDVLVAGSGDATLTGGMGDATLQGGSGNATMYAGDGNDVLIAASGNATIYGGDGNATMQGGTASTLMVAGSGSTTMVGGAGQDTFQIGSDAGDVVIYNFAAGDKLELSGGISIDDLTIGDGASADGSIEGLEIDLADGGSVLLAAGSYSDSSQITFDGDESNYTVSQLIESADSFTSITLADGSTEYQVVTDNGQGQSTIDDYNADGGELSTTSISNDGRGNTASTTYSPSGAKTGSSYSNADGSKGSATFNPDGSSETLTTQTSGATEDSVDDGSGDTYTYDFSANHVLLGDSWADSSGDTGVDTVAIDGGMTGSRKNEDGSTSSYVQDAAGNAQTNYYNASGILTETLTANSDGTSTDQKFNTAGAVVSTTTTDADGATKTIADDGVGNTSTTLRDPTGSLISDSWTKSDGSHGSDAVNGNAETSNTYADDGTYVSKITDGSGKITIEDFDSNGEIAYSSWTRPDGAHNNTTYAGDGSSTSTTTNPDGSYFVVATSSDGEAITTNYSADGTVISVSNPDTGGLTSYTTGDANANYAKDGIITRMSYTYDDGTPYTPKQNWYDGQYYYDMSNFDVTSSSGAMIQDFHVYLNQNLIQYGGPANVVEGIDEETFGQGGDTVSRGLMDTGPTTYGDAFMSQWGPLSDFIYWGGTYTGDVLSSSNSSTSTTTVTTTTKLVPKNNNPTLITGFWTTLPDGTMKVSIDGGTFLYSPGNSQVKDLSGSGVWYSVSGLSGAQQYIQQTIQSSETTTKETDNTTYVDGVAVVSHRVDGYITDSTLTDAAGDKYVYTVNGDPDAGLSPTSLTGGTSTGYSVNYQTTDQGFSLELDGPTGLAAKQVESDNGSVDWAKDQFGNIFSAQITNQEYGDGTVNDTDIFGDSITLVGTGGSGNAMIDEVVYSATYDESWVESDGTKVTVYFDPNTASSASTMQYVDGSYTAMTSTRDGSYFGQNISSSGAVVGDEWYDASSGTQGSDIVNADGSVNSSSKASDGSVSTQVTSTTGEQSGTTTHADGSVDTWDDLPVVNGVTESKTTHTDASGFETWYDTFSQADGSFTQTTRSSDGSSGTNTYDATTSQTGGSVVGTDGTTTSWTTTPNADGSTETLANYTYADGSSIAIDTIDYADGASADTWTRSDGSKGSDAYGAQSGAGDTFVWERGDTYAELQTYDGNDSLAIGSGVANDQLWFEQNGSNLDISIMGTSDDITITGWYSGAGNQLASISLADGEVLNGSDVQKLVDAMAGFAPPDASQTEYTAQERNVIAPVIATSWHH